MPPVHDRQGTGERTNTAGAHILQLFAGTVGAWLCAMLLGAWLYFSLSIPTGWKPSPASKDRLLVALTGGLAITLGYVINERLRQRERPWVWVLPLAWLAANIADEPHIMFHDPQAYALAHPPSLHRALLALWADYFFGKHRYGLINEGLGMIATAVFVGSAGNSVGAWLALRKQGCPRRRGADGE